MLLAPATVECAWDLVNIPRSSLEYLPGEEPNVREFGIINMLNLYCECQMVGKQDGGVQCGMGCWLSRAN